jgi:hypothetical protein
MKKNYFLSYLELKKYSTSPIFLFKDLYIFFKKSKFENIKNVTRSYLYKLLNKYIKLNLIKIIGEKRKKSANNYPKKIYCIVL